MIYRIFDHVLAGHTWSPAGDLQIAEFAEPDQGAAPASPESERKSLLARLAIRAKSDRIMCRAARRLLAEPSLPLDRLASELGVSEKYLLSGLRAVLGVGPAAIGQAPAAPRVTETDIRRIRAR
jgi:AraC-like DNA-binding protein